MPPICCIMAAISGSFMSKPESEPAPPNLGMETWETRRVRSVLPQLSHFGLTSELMERTNTLTGDLLQALQENS